MPLNLLAMLKGPAAWGSKIALKFASERLAQWSASKQAMKGEDLIGKVSLRTLIQEELRKLAASNKKFPELQPKVFKNWLLNNDNIELFVETTIAAAGGNPTLADRAEKKLINSYERLSRNTGTLADNSVQQVVSYICGQIQATETGRQSLQSALVHWSAAKLLKLDISEKAPFPNDADLARVHATAEKLLEAGKRSWKMPEFVAPLTLEAHEKNDEHQPKRRQVSISDLSTEIDAGSSLILFGEGGIGKTTFLLDLCFASLNNNNRTPLFVDAAHWAQTNNSLLGYLASRAAATTNSVTIDELTKMAEIGRLVIMINGWNEIPGSLKAHCVEELNQLSTVANELSIVVVSRSSSDTPTLPNSKQIEVQGLSWEGQSAIIRAELNDFASAALLDVLTKKSQLRHAARSPLILRGLIAQARKGTIEYSSVMELLAAAVQAFEEDGQRKLALFTPPIDGHQNEYLEELACILTQNNSINCSRNEALKALNSAADKLAASRLIGQPPQPAAVLEVLISHHLLHLEDNVIRFVHQRFQEYYAAQRLLRECIDNTQKQLLPMAVNQPFWEESLLLVAEKLKGEKKFTAARVHLLKAAVAIDLGLTCNLTSACAFNCADDSELHRHIVTRINNIASSPLEEVRDLGISYKISSNLSDFAEDLWHLFEEKNKKNRLFTTTRSAIAISQLGEGAYERIASWPTDLRVEFVHEISNNPRNYEFLVNVAQNEQEIPVRSAAISCLFWQFPTSEVALQAWLNAPIELQIEHNVLNCVLYALEDGYANDAIRNRLVFIADYQAPSNDWLLIRLATQHIITPRSLDTIFEALSSREHLYEESSLLDIAHNNSPERLKELAFDITLQVRQTPKWLSGYWRKASSRTKSFLFDKAWDILKTPDFTSLNGETLGSIASKIQIERCVSLLIDYSNIEWKKLTESEQQRKNLLEHILKYVTGSELLNIVFERANAASYREAALLCKIVLQLIERNDESSAESSKWQPTPAEVKQMIKLYSTKEEGEEIQQSTVLMYLCSIAGHVDAQMSNSLLLETCHEHLNAWSIFKEKIEQWSYHLTSPRPSNPNLGRHLISAIVKWGPNSLPSLIELMNHPCSMEVIPNIIARVASAPWLRKKGKIHFESVSSDLMEGENRRTLGRALQQPDDRFQNWTDDAALALSKRLELLLASYTEEQLHVRRPNKRAAEYAIGNLAGIISRIPSTYILKPLQQTLISSSMNINDSVDVLRGLVRQGHYIVDTTTIEKIEELYETTISEKWHDQNLKQTISDLSELLVCGINSSALNKPVTHYIETWHKFSHSSEIIRRLESSRSESAWPALMKLSRANENEDIARALILTMKPVHLAEFITLVGDGRLFKWCHSDWTLRQLAPTVAKTLENEKHFLEAFLDACRGSGSLAADSLAGEVLGHIKCRDETLILYLLQALDAGRAAHQDMPAYRLLEKMFRSQEPINTSQFEILQKESNKLRIELYKRAIGTGSVAESCKRLLASIESNRRALTRPAEEPRHPILTDNLVWTDALLT